MSEDKNMISDEAVEAAAGASVDKFGLHSVASRYETVRTILEAAAPHMLADAQANAWESGKDAVWAFLSNQDPQRNRPTNPYRS